MNEFPYEHPVNPAEVGVDERKLLQAASLFNSQHAKGVFPGGQLVVRRYGKVVLNQAVGVARGHRDSEGIPPLMVQPTTPFPALSTGKPLAAVAIAMLEDRGLLDVEAPIAEFLPEFGKHGKGEITILDVLTHRAGLLLPDLIKNHHLWNNRETILHHLVEAKPAYPRGTLIYAAYEYGWLLSELFMRIEKRPLADFVCEEISTPLELPALRFGLAGRKPEDLAFSYWLGKEKVMVSDINVAENFEETNNSAEQIDSLNPAVSIVTDAACLAAFYEFLLHGGKSKSGRQLISREIIRKYTSINVSGIDRSSRTPMSLGRGFMLGSKFVSTFGWWGSEDCFGHGGGFSSLAFGDYKTKIAVGIVTNGNRSFYDMARRLIPLSHHLRQVVMGKKKHERTTSK
jgi:CubicO group peptidase (beta-lactamase class C family)